jgi:CheY-like chemotaxis protein
MAGVPVVAISANAMPHDISRGLKAGFFRYLTKPIKVNEFMETLNSALELSASRRVPPPAPQEIVHDQQR